MRRNIIINAIDVKYREIENFDNQYDVMSFILGHLSDEQLQVVKKYADDKKEIDYIENNN